MRYLVLSFKVSFKADTILVVLVVRVAAMLCSYWSVTTIATVGYGDVVPHRNRAIFAATFLVSVILFAFVLGESVALLSEVHNYRRLDAFFERGLTPEILDSMDSFRDGQVRAHVPFPSSLLLCYSSCFRPFGGAEAEAPLG
jgi:hypothetical protein